ncbi:MAG: GNAT family N-acetyltransferase [Firmicutes bacterium]|nr:GNAT family N-acetyltransferase [Bacillota bacterium]MCL5971161.1 GNAT family N-acetyltransferase [Bacillota bacterium]
MLSYWTFVDNPAEFEICKPLLFLAMGLVTAQKTAYWREQYMAGNPYQLWNWRQNTQLAGIFGLKLEGDTNHISHIAVSATHRHQGIGSQMVGDMAKHFPAQYWIAETDDDALRFYQSLGFTAQILVNQPPGFSVRYRCVREMP